VTDVDGNGGAHVVALPLVASTRVAPFEPGLVSRTELTPSSFLRRAAIVLADRPAVVHGSRRISYRELGERSNRLASALRGAGIEKHDRVAILAPNSPALVEAHFGVPAAGAILVAINTRLNVAEVDAILADCLPRLILVDAELAHLVPEAAARGARVVRITDTGARDDPYEELLAEGAPDDVEPWLADEEEPISINYTSGTTGGPKGVVYTHRGAYLNALAQVIESGLGDDSVFLSIVPLFHCNGWCFPWAVAAVGATHVCVRKVDPGLVWEVIDTEGVTHTNGAPTVHIAVTNHPAAHPLERPVTVMVAGAPPSPTLLHSMRELNFRPLHVYGLTETYGPFTRRVVPTGYEDVSPDEQARLLARQGQCHSLAELVRVVGDELEDVPADGETMGEVVMRGNLVMQGYWGNAEATAAAFRGGWFHSGDSGVVHPDGSIELRDRKKDIIISGGENISTIEVEQAVMSHPAVLECAVVAMPDDHWGERPKAFVTLKDGVTATEDEIIEHCRGRIARYKCPAAVEFCTLPKTSTGKVQKFVLREQEWAGRERRIN
jgi:fatty-acyl-CoA synthase